jgi:hypothetical protein
MILNHSSAIPPEPAETTREFVAVSSDGKTYLITEITHHPSGDAPVTSWHLLDGEPVNRISTDVYEIPRTGERLRTKAAF